MGTMVDTEPRLADSDVCGKWTPSPRADGGLPGGSVSAFVGREAAWSKSYVGGFAGLGRSALFCEVVRNGCCLLVGVRQHADGRVPTPELLADGCLVQGHPSRDPCGALRRVVRRPPRPPRRPPEPGATTRHQYRRPITVLRANDLVSL